MAAALGPCEALPGAGGAGSGQAASRGLVSASGCESRRIGVETPPLRVQAQLSHNRFQVGCSE